MDGVAWIHIVKGIFYLCKITRGMWTEGSILLAFIKLHTSCPVKSCHSCCKISWTDFNMVNGTLLPINAEWCFQTPRMGSKWGCGACVLAHAHIATPTCPLPMPMPAWPVHQSSLYLPSSLIPQLPHQDQTIHLLLIAAEPLKYCFIAPAGTATHWWYV